MAWSTACSKVSCAYAEDAAITKLRATRYGDVGMVIEAICLRSVPETVPLLCFSLPPKRFAREESHDRPCALTGLVAAPSNAGSLSFPSRAIAGIGCPG